MNQEKSAKFYASLKISRPFKVFLAVFIIIALSFVGFLLYQGGEKPGHIFPLIAGALGCMALIYWIFTRGMRKIQGLDDLSEAEKLYAEDISKLKITGYIKKYAFSDMDIQGAVHFIVAMGYLFKWILFWIFAGGTIVVLLRKDTILNIAIISFLALIWCPWIEDALIKKVDYKLIFAGKLLFTIMFFAIGICLKA